MFFLRTGTPGAGKTLSLIDELSKIKDRPIFYHGIPDLSPSLGWVHVDDPKDYHNCISDGSIFVLDEAQKHFPVRAPKQPVPSAISFIETHRHRGVDIHFITQHPNLIDHHARRLVGHHTHLQRNFGAKFSNLYTDNKLFDYSDFRALSNCQRKTYYFPKAIFSLYKSAEVHTHKFKFPIKLLLLVPFLALIIYGVYTIYHMFHKNDVPVSLNPVPAYKIDSAAHGQVASGSSSGSSGVGSRADSSSLTPKQWQAAFTPAVPGLPYTAPFYKDLAKPVALPVVAGCVSSWKKCTCYTQQATVIQMEDGFCRMNVKHHQFNPFKASPDDFEVSGGRPGPVSPASPASAGSLVPQPVNQSPSPSPSVASASPIDRYNPLSGGGQ